MYKDRTIRKKNWNYLLVLIWIFPTRNFSWFARWKLVVIWIDVCLYFLKSGLVLREIEIKVPPQQFFFFFCWETRTYKLLHVSWVYVKWSGNLSFFPLQTFISFNYSQRDDISISVKEVVCYSWKEAKNALHMMMMITSPKQVVVDLGDRF